MQGIMGEERYDVLPAILSSELSVWIAQDIPHFLETLDGLSSSVRTHGDRIRQTLERNGEIRKAETSNPFPIGAVDCADLVQHFGEVLTVLALGIRVDPQRSALYQPCRVTDVSTEAAKHLRMSLRIAVETSLIAGAECPVIVDNSWWSFLIDTNKVITAYHNLTDAQGRGAYADVIARICGRNGRNGSLVSALYNQQALAVSKSGTSKVMSERPDLRAFFSKPVTDLVLFSAILEENEYTRPRLIKDMTGGHYGIESRGWDAQDRERILDRFRSSNGLHVTYYKPWAFKKAYRLEYDPTEYAEDRFHSLLATVKHETRFPTIPELVQQMTADVLSKQVASLAKLYGPIHAPRYQELYISTRTKR